MLPFKWTPSTSSTLSLARLHGGHQTCVVCNPLKSKSMPEGGKERESERAKVGSRKLKTNDQTSFQICDLELGLSPFRQAAALGGEITSVKLNFHVNLMKKFTYRWIFS